jgi:hypothetical protein
MDTNLIALRTFDFSLAYELANTPELFDAFTEDDSPEYMPDVVNEHWVIIYSPDGIAIGGYRIGHMLRKTVEIHAFILPEFRADYAKESGRLILSWCLENLDFEKMVTFIPQLYKNIYHFTKQQGFKEEGFNRSSFLKGGKMHGMYHMGITKAEIIESLGVDK